MSFADNLVFLRQHYGITQERLAEQLGVSRQTVSKWEAGTNYPEMDKLLALCDLFNANMDELMRGSVSITKANDTETYNRHMNRFDASMVAGVALILVGVGVCTVLSGFGAPDNLQSVTLLSFVVVGVVCFVLGSLSHGEFKRRNPAIEPHYDDAVLERFSRRFPIMITAGVAIILLDVIFLVGFMPDADGVRVPLGSASVVLEDVLMGPFMLIMAVAVGLLIWAGMQKSKYDLSELTYIAHRTNLGADLPPTAVVKSPEQVRADRIMGVICGCIMLLATIVFLVWGFVPLFDQAGGWAGTGDFDKMALKDAVRSGQGGFAVSWLAFVVGGILCGIVCLVGSVVGKSKEDWIAEARQEDAWMKQVYEDAGTEGSGAVAGSPNVKDTGTGAVAGSPNVKDAGTGAGTGETHARASVGVSTGTDAGISTGTSVPRTWK